MEPRKEIEEQLARNSCMNLNSPDSVMIGDAIRTLARIMLDIRELLINNKVRITCSEEVMANMADEILKDVLGKAEKKGIIKKVK